jgi:hypothetical protein
MDHSLIKSSHAMKVVPTINTFNFVSMIIMISIEGEKKKKTTR